MNKFIFTMNIMATTNHSDNTPKLVGCSCGSGSAVHTFTYCEISKIIYRSLESNYKIKF